MKESAGVLMFRRRSRGLEVLVAHPGGPFFSRRTFGAWTIPKGLIEPGEEPEAAARREFEEETGTPVQGQLIDIGSVRLRSGKIIHAFACEGDMDTRLLHSNQVEIEWPRRSGRMQSYPELDEARFVSPEEARELLNPAQVQLVDRLVAILATMG